MPQRIIDRCRELARFTDDPSCISRNYLSRAMHDVHRMITAWCESAGCKVNIDAAGNIRATYGDGGRRLMIGSHLDTVPNAGAFDGVLGVMLGLRLIELLGNAQIPFTIELIGFSEEEGVRYGIPFIGSRAVAGDLDPELIETIAPAIREFGLDPADLPLAKIADDAAAYIEFHIEQGPVLEHNNLSLGVVHAIAGQSRLQFRFLGNAGHAGTAPMALRRDALACAAEWIVCVEQHAQQTRGLVATVGKLEVEPGAGNVVPGSAGATLDVRHANDYIRHRAVDILIEAAREISCRRGLQCEHQVNMDQSAVSLDDALTAQLAAAVTSAGYPVYSLVSGAGHDAMIMARRVPSAMLFVRSPGGISHHPDESVSAEDVGAALAAGSAFLKSFGASSCTTS